MPYTIQPMTRAQAEDIARWTYANEYALYSFTPDADTLAELLCGDYYSCVDRQGRLIGYFCAGQAARIPTAEGFAYANDCLDIGLGMRPSLCGKGQGYAFMACGMRFLRERYGISPLRLTVAAFNARAIALYQRHGFVTIASVTHTSLRKPFYIMIKGLSVKCWGKVRRRAECERAGD